MRSGASKPQGKGLFEAVAEPIQLLPDIRQPLYSHAVQSLDTRSAHGRTRREGVSDGERYD